MVHLKERMEQLEIWKGIIVLFLFGIVLGSIFGNIASKLYEKEIMDYTNYLFSNIDMVSINALDYFIGTVFHRMPLFFFIWIFSFTIFEVPYLILMDIYQGFSFGFLIAAMICCYGWGGAVVGISYSVPQCFIYVPIILITMVRAYTLHKRMEKGYYGSSKGRWESIGSEFPIILLLFLGMLIGCFLETTLNIGIVKNAGTLIR